MSHTNIVCATSGLLGTGHFYAQKLKAALPCFVLSSSVPDDLRGLDASSHTMAVQASNFLFVLLSFLSVFLQLLYTAPPPLSLTTLASCMCYVYWILMTQCPCFPHCLDILFSLSVFVSLRTHLSSLFLDFGSIPTRFSTELILAHDSPDFCYRVFFYLKSFKCFPAMSFSAGTMCRLDDVNQTALRELVKLVGMSCFFLCIFEVVMMKEGKVK